MQKLKPFILLIFYLIFSLGIGFNIHYCEQGNIEFSFFKPSEEKNECHKPCNHHNSDKDCECEEEFILLSLSNNQLAFKKLITSNIDIINENIYYAVEILIDETSKLESGYFLINCPLQNQANKKLFKIKALLYTLNFIFPIR